ncbi:MAG TPA: cytochrome c-type biogenesis protein CcmH [Candidatus Krumholzibacteria bacterium]|nr:cytochrome c-type biogenesis protein CcmH [Candidatus Krumholzibacteria bacterium]
MRIQSQCFCSSKTRAGAVVLTFLFLSVAASGARAQTSPADSTAGQPAVHHHMNVSKTGPGPTGALVQRSEAMNERLYQHLKGLYMSPYCPGLTLGSCGSTGAELLRADLREWVFEGHKEEDINRYMIATFGDEIMGRPPFRGTAILVWVAPGLAVLLGLWLAMAWIRRNSRRKLESRTAAASGDGASPAAEDESDPQLAARVEAEIRAREV